MKIIPAVIDIPTAIKSAEAATLRELAAGARVMEFGSLFGYSTIVMASVADRVIAVDPHEGYPTPSSPGTLEAFMRNLTRCGVRGKVEVVPRRAQDTDLTQWGPVDLVFVDVCEEALELLDLAHAMNPKWIALHDVGVLKWHGATRAARVWRKRLPVKRMDTLVVFGREGA